ncbi:hypothetical protein ATANTOWER_009491 [Ataeniobius toweri]|uniref:Uncharacterized protein n=1 Tax=Ataeniobius toweri TaxID=208326 RepID=A0ABU7BPL1_9TELE|nr:hypothetical protein [Ataeniobius toweri]
MIMTRVVTLQHSVHKVQVAPATRGCSSPGQAETRHPQIAVTCLTWRHVSSVAQGKQALDERHGRNAGYLNPPLSGFYILDFVCGFVFVYFLSRCFYFVFCSHVCLFLFAPC